VLRALGRSDRLAQSTLRLSLGRFTTSAEVDYAARRVVEEIGRLRAIAPDTLGATP
jgi:cysteine desulfurase